MKNLLLVGLVCLLAVTALTHAEEEPACWLCPCQPYGDANCDGYITAVDVQMLMNAWGGYAPCPDFDHNGLITSLEVQILLSSWGRPLDCQVILN